MGNWLISEASAPWTFFFFFYFKDRKVALATEQTTFLFLQILGVLFLWPSASLLVYASYSTIFQSLVTPYIPTPPASLRERRLLSLGSFWLPEILGDTVFFISLTSCHLFFLSVYVPCLVQLRSSSGSRGNVMCGKICPVPVCGVNCALDYQMVSRYLCFGV